MRQMREEINVARIAELLCLRHAIVFDNISPDKAHARWKLCNKDFWEKQVLTVIEAIEIGD